MQAPLPESVDRILVRYEDLVADLEGEAERLATWLDVELDAAVVETTGPIDQHHVTSASVPDSVGRWRRDLSDTHAHAIAEGLRERIAGFGYRL